jgi:carbamoyl-phosphate synthase large subunit
MNLLLTSAGRRTYLVKYFQEALNGEGKVHASNSSFSPALQVADKSVITPLIYDKEYIDFLLKYCKENDIKAIISLFDIDLPVLAKAKKLFEKNGITVVVSNYEVTQICNDKWKTYEFFKKNNILTPKTFLSLEEVSKGLRSKDVSYPLIIKPRWGMGSIGIYTVDNQEELGVLYKKVKREIENSYLKYESRIDIDNAVLIQEKIEGEEYGLDVINDLKGNYVTTFIKKKLEMRSGETDSAVTLGDHQLERIGKQISTNLKHIANLDVDCFRVDEKIYVLEMNCRLGGGYPFSHLAGVDLPRIIVAWLENEDIFVESWLQIKSGVKGIKNINPTILNN